MWFIIFVAAVAAYIYRKEIGAFFTNLTKKD